MARSLQGCHHGWVYRSARRPVLTSVFTGWTLQPVGAVGVLLLATVYPLGERRLPAPGFLTRSGDLRQTLPFHPSLSSTDLLRLSVDHGPDENEGHPRG